MSIDHNESVDIDHIMEDRRKAVKAMQSSNNPLADSCMALELLAAPFFLGIDEDEDDSDMVVWP